MRVKTRTLLLLAVGCGLAILIAGGIKLFLVADEKQPAHLTIGESAKVGDMTVGVKSASLEDGQLLVSVELVGVDDTDGALSWIFGNGSEQLSPQAPAAGAGEPCGATHEDTPTACVLAFLTDDAQGVLRYERGGDTARWDIGGATG